METALVDRVDVACYTVPTDRPESDGTFAWHSTSIVIVEIEAAGVRGLGCTYADTSTARLAADLLAPRVRGRDAMDVPAAWMSMVGAIRNLGRPGIASMAISAIDNALWDLKSRLLGLPLVSVLGAVRDGIDVYGSGGFTSYSQGELEQQLGGWVERGIGSVKMKVGTRPAEDPGRVAAARRAIGGDARLFVDANGAYDRKQALAMAETFAREGVSWFEEPVSSDDLAGLRLLRDRGPAGMRIAAGEYGYDATYFRKMLEAGAVDVLQADATRCAGISGFLQAGALAFAHGLPLSAHTAPSMHVHACCASPAVVNLEYFHDHVRIEQMFFDGALEPEQGRLRPDRSRPGHGLELKRRDVERYRVA